MKVGRVSKLVVPRYVRDYKTRLFLTSSLFASVQTFEQADFSCLSLNQELLEAIHIMIIYVINRFFHVVWSKLQQCL